MSAEPELSVLLPYRDAELTLDEALASVLAQEHVALELIAVDDGSRDRSAEIAAACAARDPRLRALAGSGRGIADALNLAAAAARAPLLARMDADDVALPGRLRAQADRLRADAGLAAIGTQVELFPEAAIDEGMRRYVQWQNGLLSAEEHRLALFIESPLCHPSVVMRADALAHVGGYRDGPFPEDYDLWLRFDAAGFGLAKLPAVLLRWRLGPGRATLRDPRYGRDRFLAVKAPHLAARIRGCGRPIDVWGAGGTGKRLARALEGHGVRADRFIDIDPRKIGSVARGAPIVPVDAIAPPPERFVIVALGARGARDLAKAELDRRGCREGIDYLCAS